MEVQMEIQHKYDALRKELYRYGSVIVAFSGGVDSSFLLKVAQDVLEDKVLAVTAESSTFPQREVEICKAFTKKYGIRHQLITSEELAVDGFSDNPVNRCYLCKRELFGKIKEISTLQNIPVVLEGSNYDDLGDFRPGRQAVMEFGIQSPLLSACLTKKEIRSLAKEMDLDCWDKPAFACLSSRFPYGEKITLERLSMIDRSEELLIGMGFAQARVRFHQEVARIEIPEQQFAKIMKPEVRETIYRAFKGIGFQYTTLDLQGYRAGSMNEGLTK